MARYPKKQLPIKITKSKKIDTLEEKTDYLTPIEVLLQVSDDGTVSAKNVYEFLELNPTHYSRWCKKKIIENEFAEENVDFWSLAISGERFNPNATTDYKLTISFAKKLCMLQKNERGEQARNYFIKVEEKLKEIAKKPQQAIDSNKTKRLEIQEKNANTRMSQAYLRIAESLPLSKEQKNVFLSLAVRALNGQETLSLLDEAASCFPVRNSTAGRMQITNIKILVFTILNYCGSSEQEFKYLTDELIKSILKNDGGVL